MKEKLMRFMAGRYGFDPFGRATLIGALIVMVLSGLFESAILSLLAWALIIYTYFRLFSRNIYRRSAENQAYLEKTRGIRTWFNSQKSLMAQRKTHHIYKCPTCHQKIRVPRGKGRIEIRCPKCQTRFIKKS
ncbi:MAG TPA: zinc-ribbon domain-containing protein [Candidatus Dorea stercoravium]|nr:zinc-ribbon domain-containing protein [Candidatus Dorea stercoravium]